MWYIFKILEISQMTGYFQDTQAFGEFPKYQDQIVRHWEISQMPEYLGNFPNAWVSWKFPKCLGFFGNSPNIQSFEKFPKS